MPLTGHLKGLNVFEGIMTRDEYISSAFQVIKNNERAAAGISAAQVGTLLVRSLNVHWTAFGYPALKWVLQELEAKKLVRLGPNPKGAFTVWLAEEAPTITTPTTTRPFLRKEVWNAFVSPRPLGRRFMERSQGIIRMGIDEAPTPPELWAEIKRVGDDLQKTWLREYLESRGLGENGNLREALGDPVWFYKVPLALRALNPDFVKDWNWRRSERVTQHVQSWCDAEGVPRSLTMATPDAPTTPVVATLPAAVAPTTAHRELVLAALARMSTDELLALPIPAKYLLATAPPR
jgi:hypothetical protein